MKVLQGQRDSSCEGVLAIEAFRKARDVKVSVQGRYWRFDEIPLSRFNVQLLNLAVFVFLTVYRHSWQFVTVHSRLWVNGAVDNSFCDRFVVIFLPVGGSDLWILAVSRAFLTALTLFEPLRIFADPNIVVIPRVPHQDFRAVHELLSVRAVETHSAAGPRNVRAVLPPLVHNHADLELGIHSRKLSSELVVVKAINVHNTVDLKLAL